MIKIFKVVLISAMIAFTSLSTQTVKAQCAMCAANAEAGTKNGSKVADGLNAGVMYLLAAPYIAAAAVGYIWYKKYRRKNVELKMRDEKFHLN